MSVSPSSNDILTTQKRYFFLFCCRFCSFFFSGTIESSCQLESLLDLGKDPFDGLDVEEMVTELFEEHTRGESTNKVGETSKKVEISSGGIQIAIHREVEEKNRERISENTRKTTAE